MFGGKASGYQLTVEAILAATSDEDGMHRTVMSPKCCVLSYLCIPGVGKLFGVEGQMSPQGTCCGPDRYILREKLITVD